MPPAIPRRRRPRPVADAPIDALLPRAPDLAKGWLLALLEQASLDEAPGILGAGLVVDGPRLCDAVLRALADDLELRRLEPDGALGELAARVGDLAGAGSGPLRGRAVAVVRAVDALQGVLWTALRDELRGPDPDLVSELAERLALVCGLLRVAALDTPGALEGHGALEGAPPKSDPLAASAPPPGPAPIVPPKPTPRGATGAGALWMGALEDEINRAADSPLALLLAELEDAERVAAAEDTAGATATFEHFARAVRGALRRQDILVCETDTRAWIIARGTARTDAQMLGTRVAEAVGAGTRWRGAPLTATVGLAVLGEDGRTCRELIEVAEEARFAASASGTDVSL